MIERLPSHGGSEGQLCKGSSLHLGRLSLAHQRADMDKEKFVLCVCGGRDYQDKDKVFRTLDRVNAKRRIDVLVQGECPTGADLFAKQWAKERGVQHFGFLANWREFGKRAGPMRNQ